jgi:hypothetical protein
MRRTLIAAALAISMAVMAVPPFASTPAKQPQVLTPSPVAQTRLVSQSLADEIFLPAPDVAPAPVFAVIRGVCSVTCAECYGPYDCPPDPDTGLRQSCTHACY